MRPILTLFITCLFLLPNFVLAQDQSGYATSITRDVVKPPYLKKGDTIMILAPAGRIKDKSSVDQGIELANHWGLVVFLGNHLFSQDNTFAGTDGERLEDLQNALDNPSIKAIWCARGGYGAVRIVDELDFTRFMQRPKWIVGYSDITVLHNKLNQLGVESIHAQMPLTLKLNEPIQKESITALKKSLFGKKLGYSFDGSTKNRNGEATGQLVGGNLSIVYSMLSSDIDLNMDGKILFVEDVGEALYHIDRMLISLKRAGYFEKCAGLIVGDFKLKSNEGNEFGETLEDIVNRVTEGTDFPILFDFPAGHIDDNRALILGDIVELKVSDNKSKLTFK
ncbi:S66 peptidase family protein [Namhaeicola litoreus]|uniref:LD-carboxypeptidase n=1 Tax=Namhaeicola litoreus TaxID=1052145 RepID=A0ABW3Y0N4_9FLAO